MGEIFDKDINTKTNLYDEKNIDKSNDDIEKNSNEILVVNQVDKAQKEIYVSNIDTQQQVNKIKKEKEDLYKKKILELENEKLQLNNRIRILEEEENNFIKKLINIMDEIYRMKYYADNCGNDKLKDTVARNLKSIKKELADMNISIIPSLDEEFNEDYHDCIDIREDLNKENMKIVEEIKAGFIYKGKVIRPAEVVVIKNKGVDINE